MDLPKNLKFSPACAMPPVCAGRAQTGGRARTGRQATKASASPDPTYSTLTILNISDPSNITRLGSYEDASILGNAYGIIVRGKFAYVTGSATDSLVILDVSDPTNITYVDSYSDSTYMDGAQALNLVGNYAVVSNRSSINDYHIAVLDVSDPTNITFVSALANSDFQPHHTVAIRGRYIYGYTRARDKFTILEMPALDMPFASFGNVNASDLAVDNNLNVGRNLFAHNGVNVGSGGLFVSNGETGFSASSTQSALTVRQSSTGAIVNIYDGDTEVFTILDGGNVGIGTTTPESLLNVFDTATSTIEIDSNSLTQGSCLKLKDVDGDGYTYCYVDNGAMICSTTSCE